MSGMVTPEPIFDIAVGFMAAKHLLVAGEVGLFEALAGGGATLDEVAERCRIPRRTARILADANIVLGFVERDGETYRNRPVAEAYLAGKGATDLRPFLRFWNRISYPAWNGLDSAVRSGQPVMHGLTREQTEISSVGIEAFTAPVAEALAATYEFDRHRRMLDVGGGLGFFLVTALERHGHLEATLFDLPAVAQLAGKRLADNGWGDRITVIPGDFLVDPLPSGHDVLLVANVMHQLGPAANVALLRRLRSVAPERCRLLLVDMWTDPSHTRPPMAGLMAGEFLVLAGGDVYSEEELRHWLASTGWLPIEHQRLSGPWGLVVAQAA